MQPQSCGEAALRSERLQAAEIGPAAIRTPAVGLASLGPPHAAKISDSPRAAGIIKLWVMNVPLHVAQALIGPAAFASVAHEILAWVIAGKMQKTAAKFNRRGGHNL